MKSSIAFVLLMLSGTAFADEVYLRSNTGAPWGLNGNETAMDTVFGGGQWQDLRYETVNPAAVFNANNKFVFMEGGDSTADEMETFLGANQAIIEDWVLLGGCLLLNSAPNEGDGMSYGFGGISLVLDTSDDGFPVNLAHPVYDGPYGTIGLGVLEGDSWSHAHLTGPGLSAITLQDDGDVSLAELPWGAGQVVFGGETLPFFTSHPQWQQPEATIYHANLLYYAGCVPTPATAGLLGLGMLGALRRRR